MKFWHYIKAAFTAKPGGMFVSPNLVAVAGVALAGLVNPGIWLIGAGLEMAWLLGCAHHPRFRKLVDARLHAASSAQQKLRQSLDQLPPEELRLYDGFAARCRDILKASADPGPLVTEDFLGKLLWLYLQLLQTGAVISRHLRHSEAEEREEGSLEKRRREVDQALKKAPDDMRRSLQGRLDILRQRLELQKAGEEKLGYVQAELRRLEDQVQLIHDQVVLQADTSGLNDGAERVDEEVRHASHWIAAQREVYKDLGGALDAGPQAFPVALAE